jgi:ABC-2 type transport system permease protein
MWDMKSKTSFINKGVFVNELKRFSWIGILYTLAMLFIIPLQILMVNSRNDENYVFIKSMLQFRQSEVQGFFVLIFPVLLGIFLFRYIQVKTSSDMIHSLPIRREVLYRTHLLIGVLMIVIPVLLTGIITQILNASIGLEEFYSFKDVLKWCGFTIVLDLTFFLATVLMGMITGISVLQGVLTYILLLLPMGLTMLVGYNLSYFVYGFNVIMQRNIEKLSPVVRIFNNGGIPEAGSLEVIIYITLIIALYFLCIYLYRKRRLEAAGNTMAFARLNPIFIYGISFCTMLLVGAYFYELQNSLYWMFFGYFLGSIFGYFIAQMVVRKSLWVFKNIKGYLIFAGVIVLLLLGIKMDITGYEKRVPAFENIKSIYSSYGFYDTSYSRFKIDVFTNRENLLNIHELHREIIKDKKKNHYAQKNTRNIVFEYELKDGKRIRRGYKINEKEYSKYFKPIYESMEYRLMHRDVLSVDSVDVEKLTINANMRDKSTVILKPEDIKEAISILKKENESESYEQMTDGRVPWGGISIMISDKSIKKYPKLNDENMKKVENQIYVEWKKCYKEFDAWLQSKGYYENARVTPQDIEYVIVEKVENRGELQEKTRTGIDLEKSNGKKLEVRDEAQIEVLLESYNYQWNEEKQKYVVGFYGKNRSFTEFGSFTEESAPDFVKAYFTK